jgi:hypothetical protein
MRQLLVECSEPGLVVSLAEELENVFRHVDFARAQALGRQLRDLAQELGPEFEQAWEGFHLEVPHDGGHPPTFCLLLLAYKGAHHEFAPTTDELSAAFSLLTHLGRRVEVAVAADDYSRRRLGLAETCGKGFLRVNLDGTRDSCCFPACEYRRG